MVHMVHNSIGLVEVSFAANEVSKGVFEPSTAKVDAFRRDFTINAIFMEWVNNSWVLVDFTLRINTCQQICRRNSWE